MKILGIDPGLAVTGYGIIEVDGDKVKLLNAGTHSTSGGMLSERLKSIFVRIFFSVSFRASLKVS